MRKTKEHKLYLGKCDGYGNGRKICRAYVTWEFADGRFSMCGEVWNTDVRHPDILSGGQNLEELLRLFPDNAQLRRMVEVWREWHLNDLTAGSPAQEAWLKANPIPPAEYAYPKSHYDVVPAKLAAVGLNPDPNFLYSHPNVSKEPAPYKYGSAWLKRDIPADIAAEINSWSAMDKANVGENGTVENV